MGPWRKDHSGAQFHRVHCNEVSRGDLRDSPAVAVLVHEEWTSVKAMLFDFAGTLADLMPRRA